MTHAILQTIHSETQDKIVIIIMRRFYYLVRHSNKNVILTGDTEWRGSVFLYAFQLVFGSFYFISHEHY